MKWFAVIFAVFIALVIGAADLGLLRGQLDALHALPMGDKIGHFVLIGLLSFLVITSLIHELPKQDPRRIALATAILMALIFGIEEASQRLIQGRDANPGDLMADYAGIAFFSWLSLKLHFKRKRSQNN
jgi:VanZ family protein